MAGLIFGIIVLLVGIVLGTYFIARKESAYVRDGYGNYSYDENGNRVTRVSRPLKKFAPVAIVSGILLAVLFIWLGCIASVPTGHTGVITTFGRVENGTFDAGFNMKAPWQKVVKMDNRVQKANMTLSCFSSDIQEVTIAYTLNYQIDKANAQEIYKNVGTAYYDTVILPNIAEAVKVVTAQYTAEQLVGSRAELAAAIDNFLSVSLTKYNIQVVSTAIEDMDFTDAFTNAVESKQVAAQNKLQAEIEQAQKVMEQQAAAEMAVIQANAAAQTAKIQAQADMEVAQISADSAEYQGKKEAAIALQRLASINGWTVVHNEESGINEIFKANGEPVTDEELRAGAEKLIEYYYIQGWDGKLPDTYVGSEDVSTIIAGKTIN